MIPFGLNKNQCIIAIVIIAVIVFVIGYYFYTKVYKEDEFIELEEENLIQKEENKEKEDEIEIIVHIAGEVKSPGIVKIQEGARIADIIEEAGGLKENADLSNINLAYPVEDGQKIVIPKKGEEQTQIKEESVIGQEKQKSKININKASKEELETLEGIGEQTAQKIIDYRKEKGAFKQKEDLKNVTGIGENKFKTIEDKIDIK